MNMTQVIKATGILLLSIATGISWTAAATDCKISAVSSFPAGSDGHTGIAGAFIGTVDNTVIIAGGSDFPSLKPWEGGKKIFYDDIYVLKPDADGQWNCTKSETSLPHALGSGCAVSDGKVLYCFGGMNENRRSSAVITVKYAGKNLQVDSVAALPGNFIPVAAAYKDGLGKIFVHGTVGGKNVLYSWSMHSMQWEELTGCPSRTLSEGCPFIYQHNGKEDAFYLIGGRGTDSEGLYLSSAIWEYLPLHDKWNRKTDFDIDDKNATLMYSSAVPYGSAHIIVFGGDDGIEFSKRIDLDRRINESTDPTQKDSLRTALAEANINHSSFCNRIFAYHTITDTWTQIGESEIPLPVVTTAAVCGHSIIIPSGEIHPGVRSNDILEIEITDLD